MVLLPLPSTLALLLFVLLYNSSSSSASTRRSTTTKISSCSEVEEEVNKLFFGNKKTTRRNYLFGVLLPSSTTTATRTTVPMIPTTNVVGQEDIIDYQTLLLLQQLMVVSSLHDDNDKLISTTTTDGNLKKNNRHQHDIDTNKDDEDLHFSNYDDDTKADRTLHLSSSSSCTSSSLFCTTTTCHDNKHSKSLLHTLRGGDANWWGGNDNDDDRNMLDDLDNDALEEMLFGNGGDPDDHDDDDKNKEPSYFMSMVQEPDPAFTVSSEINLENVAEYVAKKDFIVAKLIEWENAMASGWDMIRNGTAETNATATSMLIQQVKHMMQNDTVLSDILLEEDEQGNSAWFVSRQFEGSDGEAHEVPMRWCFDVDLEVRTRYLEACFYALQSEHKSCIDICDDILKKHPFVAANYLKAQANPCSKVAANDTAASITDDKKGDTSSAAASIQVTASTAYAFLGKNLTSAIVKLRDSARVADLKTKWNKAAKYHEKKKYAACIRHCKKILNDMIPSVRSQLLVTSEEKYHDPLVDLKRFKLLTTYIMDLNQLNRAIDCYNAKVVVSFNARRYDECEAACEEVLSIKLTSLRSKRALTTYLAKFPCPDPESEPESWYKYSCHKDMHDSFDSLQSEASNLLEEMRVKESVGRVVLPLMVGCALLMVLGQLFQWIWDTMTTTQSITVVGLDAF